MSRKFRLPGVVVIAVATCALWALPQRRAVAQDQSGAGGYIAGIEDIEGADFGDAIQSLTAAIQSDGDNETYWRARGVAETLSESFDQAISDLERARQIDATDAEAKLWLAAAYRMSGNPGKGASLFSMGVLPHDYANMVYNLMAMQYWQSRYQGHYYDPATRTQVQASAPVKTLFAQAAKTFAQRNRATGPAAIAIITQQARDAIQQGNWKLALRDLVQLRADAPDDSTLRGYWAQALVGAGNAVQAREEFTRVLCVNPLWADGFVGRAQAHMILGEQAMAQADLDAASSLGAASKDDLQRKLAAFVPPAPPADAVQQFSTAVANGADFSELVNDALAVTRLTNAASGHYDEDYQLRIFALSMDMRADPRSSDYPEMLARFLYNNYQVPVLWNGPRGGGEQVRPQDAVERDNELKRAIDLCDTSLQIDGRNTNALATKGWLLYTIKAVGPEDLADQGLAIDGQNVRLLKLKITVLEDRAGDLLAQASGLKSGHTDITRENRSDGVYEVTTHYAPTAEQLAEAARLEAAAAQLKQQAADLDKREKNVEQAVIPGLLDTGRNDLASGDLKGATKSLMRAYSLEPDLQDTLIQLIDLCTRNGNDRRKLIYTLLATPLRQSNPSVLLQAAWDSCAHMQWARAAQCVATAMADYPADARCAACQSVIAANGDQPDPAAAQRWRNMALALEEAKARLSGTTLLDSGIPEIDLFNAQQAGLSMQLRMDAGNAFLAVGQYQQAIDTFSVNVAAENRVDQEALVQPVPSAMLPAATNDGAVPPAPTVASLLAWSRFGIAKADLAMQRPQDAAVQYTAVRAYLANWPATAEGRESLNVVDSWARLGQAQAAHAAHDDQTALNILENDGWPGGLPADLDAAHKQLADQLHAQFSGQAWQNVQQQMNQSPGDARINALQQEIDAMQKQRDSIKAAMDNPNMSDQEKQARQESVAELDQLITQQKAELQQLQRK